MAYEVKDCEVLFDGELIATFKREYMAKQYVDAMTKESPYQEYWSDVRNMAEPIEEELQERIKAGERGESLREWLIEHIDECCDGAARVIYTAQAMECLRYSDNDSAYADEFGEDGMVKDGDINWSALAYMAFRADVIARMDTDVNDPSPKCAECDDDNATIADGDGWLCDTCGATEESEEVPPCE